MSPSGSGKTVGNGDRERTTGRRQAQSRDGELRVNLTRGQSFRWEGGPTGTPFAHPAQL